MLLTAEQIATSSEPGNMSREPEIRQTLGVRPSSATVLQAEVERTRVPRRKSSARILDIFKAFFSKK